jgi:hypothetical protein
MAAARWRGEAGAARGVKRQGARRWWPAEARRGLGHGEERHGGVRRDGEKVRARENDGGYGGGFKQRQKKIRSG